MSEAHIHLPDGRTIVVDDAPEAAVYTAVRETAVTALRGVSD
ncbi:hypothetical protein [Halorubrum ezzemoulense]|nr:hypothetical protein [Halorubrum ezzemoulense]